eukprot:SAG22_NODE_6065_length_906_cov_1392.240397_1_plen_190_part_10
MPRGKNATHARKQPNEKTKPGKRKAGGATAEKAKVARGPYKSWHADDMQSALQEFWDWHHKPSTRNQLGSAPPSLQSLCDKHSAGVIPKATMGDYVKVLMESDGELKPYDIEAIAVRQGKPAIVPDDIQDAIAGWTSYCDDPRVRSQVMLSERGPAVLMAMDEQDLEYPESWRLNGGPLPSWWTRFHKRY